MTLQKVNCTLVIMHIVFPDIKSYHIKNILIVLHIFSAIFAFYTYFATYKLSESLLVSKITNRQLIMAKSGSTALENLQKNIQNQLFSFKFSFAKIADDSSIDISGTRAAFSSFIQRSSPPVGEIALYDSMGKLLIIENRRYNHTGENTDFSGSEFFKWSKNPLNRDKVYFSTPYKSISGATIGRNILILASPVYFGATYKGTLSIRLLIDDFQNAFITPITLDNKVDSFIIDKDFVVLAGNEGLLNQNLAAYAAKEKWPGYQNFTNELKKGITSNITQTTWNFKNPQEKTRTLLVGISKIDIPNTDKDLFLVVTSSKQDITSLLRPLRLFGIAWLGFGVITTTIGGLILIFLRS